MYLTITPDYIYFSILKKKRSIMERTSNNLSVPFSIYNILCAIYICLTLILCDKNGIINSILISESSSPLSFTICITAITQVIDIIIIQIIVNIVHNSPVNQIFRMHDRSTGTKIHGRTYHIVIISNTNPICIGNIRISQRINTFCGLLLCVTIRKADKRDTHQTQINKLLTHKNNG